MKVLIVTDIHNDEVAAEVAVELERPDLVLDCGDHSRIRSLFSCVPHFYILGNHVPSDIILTKEDLLFPMKILPGIVHTFSDGEDSIRFSGIDGNYSSRGSPFSVKDSDVDLLKQIPEGSLDVFLTHESPLHIYHNRCGEQKLAEQVVNEINRIGPKYVFAGHYNKYRTIETSGGIKVVDLDAMGKGYHVLTKKAGDLKLERILRSFRGESH